MAQNAGQANAASGREVKAGFQYALQHDAPLGAFSIPIAPPEV